LPHQVGVLLPGPARRGRRLPRVPSPRALPTGPRVLGTPRERGPGRIGRRRPRAHAGPGGGGQRGHGRRGGQPLRALHALRQPRGLSLFLHGDDGHHGRRGWKRHAARPRDRRAALHGPSRSPPRGHGLAVADARVRRVARAPRLLPAARHRAGGERVATLAVEDLVVEFGGVAALAGVSFEVRPGTITSLIGPNGAGKTPAFNAITGYLRPRRGRVTFGGEPLSGRRPG